MDLNTKHSFKDYLDQTFLGADPKEFSDSIIRGTCFYQQAGPKTPVFPEGMTGVVFERCNLDNVLIPEGNTVEADCCAKNIMLSDCPCACDCIVDDNGAMLEKMGCKCSE